MCWLAGGSPIVCAESDYEYVSNSLPKVMEGVGIDEHLGNNIPIELPFRNALGLKTSLEEVLQDGKPVILTLNYSNCPGLCIAQMNGLVRGINEVSSLRLGTDFHLISISIDPRETTSKALGTQKKYSQDLYDQHDPEAWQFWTGDAKSIEALTQSVGFRYTYDASNDQFNHSTAAIFLSPKGKVTRYLYELGFTGNTLKMATIEAGEGRVGSSMDMIALWCVHYNPLENRYSSSARRLLSIAAGVFVAVGLAASIPFWFARRQRLNHPTSGQITVAPAPNRESHTTVLENTDTEFASTMPSPDESIRHATSAGQSDTI
jgi:protein SCO1